MRTIMRCYYVIAELTVHVDVKVTSPETSIVIKIIPFSNQTSFLILNILQMQY